MGKIRIEHYLKTKLYIIQKPSGFCILKNKLAHYQKHPVNRGTGGGRNLRTPKRTLKFGDQLRFGGVSNFVFRGPVSA